MKIQGKLIDIHQRDIYSAKITLKEGVINKIERLENKTESFICPGLIDSHIHIESSMLTPGAFAGPAVSRGTTSVVCDPHEIANVLGIEGVKFMINDAKKVPLKFWFGAPSCVPATTFETNGASINSENIEYLLKMDEIKYLAEMMNFPGVIHDDEEIKKKLKIALDLNKQIDGHAPGLSGAQLKKYINSGISTDHECSSIQEAEEKIKLGMKILMREGSAARNLDVLKDLLKTYPDMVMLCSDDLHPEMLEKQHINKLVAKLINDGYDIFNVLRSCTLNPVKHYKIDAGLLRPGDKADFIIIDNPGNMEVSETWINGMKVFSNEKLLFKYHGAEPANIFNSTELSEEKIKVERKANKILVIVAFDGELITKAISINAGTKKYTEPDSRNDILKIVVKDRYKDNPPAIAFIKGFGLKSGAFASSVAHDSHNIISVGTNDKDIVEAMNQVIKMKGGLAVADKNKIYSLALPVAGIMSDKPVQIIAGEYKSLSERVVKMGSRLSAPFMTLSFMALLVIPELKLSDKGLFDGKKFSFVPLFTD